VELGAAFYDGDITNPETAEALARLVPQSVRTRPPSSTTAGFFS
jgi:hypothetical protein